MTNLQSLSQVAALSGLSKIMLVDRKTRQTGVDENFNKFNDDFSTRNDFYFDNKENESTNFASWLLPILDSTIYELDSSKWGAGIFPESPVIINIMVENLSILIRKLVQKQNLMLFLKTKLL